MTDPGDATLVAYEQAAERYLAASARPGPALRTYLDRFVDLIGSGHVLELGSGPGWDADYLETRGLCVSRTDASRAFVARLRDDGHDAQMLDVRFDELGDSYDGVMANAVLLHLSREQFEDALQRMRGAVVDGGVLAMTLKEGDGQGWSTQKLGLARHFTYWQDSAVREVLTRTGLTTLSIAHVSGRNEPWLHVLARA